MTQKYQGAEATVTVDGEKVEKDRKKKEYRHTELDDRIRKDRNKQETRILEKARKHGVNVPEVLETSETEFKMEKMDGEVLREAVEENPELVEELAEQVARLHSANIIHGDLTTSNAIAGNRLYLIDFGLAYHSERIEDKAVDIHLLKQVLKASHNLDLWERFAERYRDEGNGEVVDKVSEIEDRARYR
ncbi:MAG: KEOPS complex kinase/ATPase Bud32 [Candidatus Nanohalobium sp.]